MNEKERVALIRKGNEFFNQGKLTEAEKIFVATMYKDGLTRIGDYFFFDKKQPLSAFKYYKLAGRKDKINEIFERMVYALGRLMHEGEEEKREEKPLPPPKVHPKLKILAEEILSREKGDKR